MNRILPFVLCATIFAAMPGEAATFTVTKTADTNGACIPSDCSLREAVQASILNSGSDTIELAAGTYRLTRSGRNEDFGQTGDLDVLGGDVLRIQGAGQSATIIDGNGIDRVLQIFSGDVTLLDLTITGGNAGSMGRQQGGAILNDDSLTLTRVTVRNNSSTGGAGDGGGVWSDGDLTVNASRFENNSASGNESDGGGLWVDGQATITRTTFVGNRVTGTLADGAGIFNSGNATITASTINDNSANGTTSDGAGIYNNGVMSITNATISGNRATGNLSEGGGIFNADTMSLLNVTIANNTASDGGTALANVSNATVTNSILSGSCIEFGVNSGGGNLESPGNTCGLGAGDQIAIGAGSLALGSLGNNGGPTNTHAIFTGSAAIDRARNNACPSTDQRGEPRPVDGDGNGTATCDVGAFEGAGGPPPACLANATSLCLNNDRFRIQVDWALPNGTGQGQAVELTDDTGYFWFFNAQNVEMVIKVLSNCTGPTNRFWVFAGGLTNVGVTIRVTDTVTDQVRTYVNQLGAPFQPIQDTDAFATCNAMGMTEPVGGTLGDETRFFEALTEVLVTPASNQTVAPEANAVPSIDRVPTIDGVALDPSAGVFDDADNAQVTTIKGIPTPCVEDGLTLCLNNNRFRIIVDWRVPNGTTGVGSAFELTDDTGYFWFFNPRNVEMVIKILNNCSGPTNRYWVFAGGLTNVAADILVQDVLTGVIKEYSNPLGTPFQPILDTAAFDTCP